MWRVSAEMKGMDAGGEGDTEGSCQEETINARVSVDSVRTLEHHPLSLCFHQGYHRLTLT